METTKTSDNKEKVSVIITTYGESKRLKRAIDSVLFQTYKNFEIIVIDDNDPKSICRNLTEKVMENYKTFDNVFYLKHMKNCNGSTARNTGIRKANGEYICFLDNDDFYLPERLEMCVFSLNNNPHCGGVYSDVLLVNQGLFSNIIHANEQGNLQLNLLFNFNLLGTGSNLFFRRKVIEETGMFDENFFRYQDVEYMLRVFDNFELCNIRKILVVKDKNGFNIPKYKKLKVANQLLRTKFDYLIKSLDIKDMQRFMDLQYTSLLSSAIRSNDSKNCKDAIENLELIRKLTRNEAFKIKNLKLICAVDSLKEKFKVIHCTSLIYYKLKAIVNRKKIAVIENSLGFSNSTIIKQLIDN
ncbi:MAG: glycosyltransferase family A protein [Aminipila sp.]